MAASIIVSVAYGFDIQEENDPYVDLIEKALHGLALAMVPGAYLVVRSACPIRFLLALTLASGYDSGPQTCAKLVPRCQIQTRRAEMEETLLGKCIEAIRERQDDDRQHLPFFLST